MLEEYRHPELESSIARELDFYFPRLNLAVEYQVTYHFYLILYIYVGSSTL